MRGLDPRIHQLSKNVSFLMDRRVKLGDDSSYVARISAI
jgi:hypothetical protein